MSGKRKRTGCRLRVGCGRASSCSCLQFLISSTCFFPAHSSRTGDAHICSQQECWRTGTSCSNYFPKAWPCKHGPWDHRPTQSLVAGQGACKKEKWSQNTASTAEQQGSHCCLPRPPARIVQRAGALPPSFTPLFQERGGPEGGKMVWQVNPQAELRRANCWLSSPQRQQDATEHQALWHALCTVTVTPTYWGLFPWLCPKGHFSSNKVSALKPLEAHNQNQRTEASRLRFPGCLPRCWWSTEEEIAFKWKKKKKDELKKKKKRKSWYKTFKVQSDVPVHEAAAQVPLSRAQARIWRLRGSCRQVLGPSAGSVLPLMEMSCKLEAGGSNSDCKPWPQNFLCIPPYVKTLQSKCSPGWRRSIVPQIGWGMAMVQKAQACSTSLAAWLHSLL